MLLEIDPHGGVPIYRQVIDQIRRQIMTGHLATGDQLESVKNLAARLKVNPMTVSKAYSFLVQEGLAERRRGLGLFVASVAREQTRRAKRQLLGEAMQNAAALAVQMGIPDTEAGELLAEHLRRYRVQKGGGGK
jgi:GntR family transcriptional regulator